MIWKQPLPPLIERKLKQILGAREQVLVQVSSDLSSRALFEESWLVVTDRRILNFEAKAGQKPRIDLDLAISSVTKSYTRPMVGGGALIAETRKQHYRVLLFSNSLSERFAHLAKGIRDLAKGRKLDLPDDLPSARCNRCGRLVPRRQERCPFCIRYFEALRRILVYLKPYAWLSVLAVLVTSIATLTQLIPPLITRNIIDVAIPGKNISRLAWLVIGFGAVNLVYAVLVVFNNRLLAWLGGRVGTDIRSQVFQAVERLTLTFFDRRHLGHIMSRVVNDSGQLQHFLIDGFPYIFQNIITLAGIIIILASYSPILTLLIMIPVPFIFVGQFVFWRVARSINHKWWNQYSLLNQRLGESISGVRVVKAFFQEQREIGRFDKQNQRLFKAQFVADSFWGMFNPGMQFFVSSGILIVWYVGGQKAMNQTMSIGTLVAFISYLWMFYGPLQWFNLVNNWMSQAFAGAERIFETMDTQAEVYEPPDAKPLPTIRGSIEFKKVTFAYEKGKQALNNVSFKIKPGEMIGFVGKSGSGKTTLLGLLCRFYVPDEGEILVDGIPINQIRLEDLRRHFGLVLQDPFLFGSSIYENISYSRSDSKIEEVLLAARAANAHDFIMTKPDAYDTRVGERGNRLSGGEKQRISIARAILHDPRVLILDEATSSVDSETESKIQQALDRLVSQRTTLVSAHRLSTLRNADRIFVMEEGRIAEIGSHKQLMARRGKYFRIVKAQEKMWRKGKKNLSLAGGKGA